MSNNYTISQPLIEKIPVVNYYKKKLSELSLNWNTLNLLNQVNEGGASIENTQKEFSKLTDSLVNNFCSAEIIYLYKTSQRYSSTDRHSKSDQLSHLSDEGHSEGLVR